MGKKIVVALGGNALGENLEDTAIRSTAKAITDLIAEGNNVVITHGNGPQVGMIQAAMEKYYKNSLKTSEAELSASVAMSQAYIGSYLQRALMTELKKRNIEKTISTIITHVEVDKNDPAFQNPTKPIGSFLPKKEADELAKKGEKLIEDSGRGYRRVVASPKPIQIVEKHIIQSLLLAGQVVISCGGGGIPIVNEGGFLKGIPAVIDKDFASAKLAADLKADFLIILTAVEKVAVNFNKSNQKWLSEMTVAEAEKLIEQGQFAKGSMLPKIEAALNFLENNKKGRVLITLLEKAKKGIEGKTGTVIKV